MRRGMRAGRATLLGIAVAAAVAVIYFTVDPAHSAWIPKCAFHSITGYDCPGCGSQRMLHALLHGDFAAAWQANAFIICVTPLLALMAYAAATRQRHPLLYSRLNSLPVIIILTVALIAWSILRNLF